MTFTVLLRVVRREDIEENITNQVVFHNKGNKKYNEGSGSVSYVHEVPGRALNVRHFLGCAGLVGAIRQSDLEQFEGVY